VLEESKILGGGKLGTYNTIPVLYKTMLTYKTIPWPIKSGTNRS